MNNLRDNMPALTNKTYFNYGGQGPLPEYSLKAIIESWKTIQTLGPFTTNVWPYIAQETSRTRALLAKLCGVGSHRMALTENVTIGCVLPLWGLPFLAGERILISDSEHPGVYAACNELARRLDLSIDRFSLQSLSKTTSSEQLNDLTIAAIEKGLNDKTRLVVVSHLLWNTGQIIPIKLISEKLGDHPNRPYLLVDGAQSFGQIPLEEAASAADIFAFTGHKWACGPEGLGGVALSERILAESSPTLIGWKTLKDENSISQKNTDLFHRDSRRFEIATSCIPLMAGLRSSLEHFEEEGSIEERLKKIQKLSHNFWEKISHLNNIDAILTMPPPAGIVSFKITKSINYTKIVKKLANRNIFLRSIHYPESLRACFHIPSLDDEIDLLINSLKDIMEI